MFCGKKANGSRTGAGPHAAPGIELPAREWTTPRRTDAGDSPRVPRPARARQREAPADRSVAGQCQFLVRPIPPDSESPSAVSRGRGIWNTERARRRRCLPFEELGYLRQVRIRWSGNCGDFLRTRELLGLASETEGVLSVLGGRPHRDLRLSRNAQRYGRSRTGGGGATTGVAA